jgi:hypothetical protein
MTASSSLHLLLMLPEDRMMRNKKRQKSVDIRETVPYVYSTVNIFPVLGGTDVSINLIKSNLLRYTYST